MQSRELLIETLKSECDKKRLQEAIASVTEAHGIPIEVVRDAVTRYFCCA